MTLDQMTFPVVAAEPDHAQWRLETLQLVNCCTSPHICNAHQGNTYHDFLTFFQWFPGIFHHTYTGRTRICNNLTGHKIQTGKITD